MVTGPSAANDFFVVPQNPDPAAPSEVSDRSLPVGDSTRHRVRCDGQRHQPEIAVFQTFDTNTRMVESL